MTELKRDKLTEQWQLVTEVILTFLVADVNKSTFSNSLQIQRLKKNRVAIR